VGLSYYTNDDQCTRLADPVSPYAPTRVHPVLSADNWFVVKKTLGVRCLLSNYPLWCLWYVWSLTNYLTICVVEGDRASLQGYSSAIRMMENAY